MNNIIVLHYRPSVLRAICPALMSMMTEINQAITFCVDSKLTVPFSCHSHGKARKIYCHACNEQIIRLYRVMARIFDPDLCPEFGWRPETGLMSLLCHRSTYYFIKQVRIKRFTYYYYVITVERSYSVVKVSFILRVAIVADHRSLLSLQETPCILVCTTLCFLKLLGVF